MIDILCEECGKALPEGEKRWCSDECYRAARLKLGTDRADIWIHEWIPRAYQHSALEKLPDPEATKLLMEFSPFEDDKPASAYIYGPTGSGKTRSVVLRLRQFLIELEDVAYIRGKQLGDEIVERTRPNGRGEFEEWFENLQSIDILAIDEVDKISFTPRVLAEFFELIECRTSYKLTTLFVAQCSVDRLAAKIGPKAKEEGAGIVRRIKENCLPIHFQKP